MPALLMDMLRPYVSGDELVAVYPLSIGFERCRVGDEVEDDLLGGEGVGFAEFSSAAEELGVTLDCGGGGEGRGEGEGRRA
jgi:hypothetical protein